MFRDVRFGAKREGEPTVVRDRTVLPKKLRLEVSFRYGMSHDRVTIDEMIRALERLKTGGVPGGVFFRATDAYGIYAEWEVHEGEGGSGFQAG
jgi:hypothetical protein